MIRLSVVIIEFAALLDAGDVLIHVFPDPEAGFGLDALGGYAHTAFWYAGAFPSSKAEAEENRPEMLPSQN